MGKHGREHPLGGVLGGAGTGPKTLSSVSAAKPYTIDQQATEGTKVWVIARHPRPGLLPKPGTATVAGLALSALLSAVTGYATAAHMGHAVGLTSGRLVLFGWDRAGGDLRAAHFLSLHLEQALPLAAGASALCVAAAVAAFAQALQGCPLLPDHHRGKAAIIGAERIQRG